MKIKKYYLQLIAGISGLVVGGGMIFIFHNNGGFIIGFLSMLLLLFNKK